MELVKNNWTKSDLDDLIKYLKTFSKGEEKCKWEQRIVNTKLPCLAVPSPVIYDITKQIYKGNYISFIDLWCFDNFAVVSILGGLISKIKDFELFARYLSKYARKIDNWASCDLLKFKVNDKNKELFFQLADKMVKSTYTYERRMGLSILFKLIDDDNYIDHIYDILNMFYNEKEYYVNMMIAWLTCECFTKQRDKTLQFLNSHKLNKFCINKAISKCRDSFRVSKEDKEMLLKYRVK